MKPPIKVLRPAAKLSQGKQLDRQTQCGRRLGYGSLVENGVLVPISTETLKAHFLCSRLITYLCSVNLY